MESLNIQENKEVEQETKAPPSSAYPTRYSRILECRLLIDPINLKSITRWLTEKVNEYEEQFGHIPPECQQQTA